MKLLLYLIVITNFMGYKEFQNLIGKHISVAKHVLADDFRNDFFGEHFYISSSDVDSNFYGIHYTNLTIITDQKGIIEEITIHLDKIIDKSFYDLFIIDYGNPSSIRVVYEKKVISEGRSTDDPSFVQDLKQSIIKTREGKFNENPLYILWNYEDYQIKVFIRQEQNVSEVIFRVPTEKF